MITYPIGASGHRVILTDDVVKQLRSHRQASPGAREAGGQLFAMFEANDVIVTAATGPRPGDRRGLRHFFPDRNAERQEIDRFFNESLNFVGDWHTHAEETPKPSQRDIRSIRDCFRKSKHSLNSFILIIVGTGEFPNGLSVTVHNDKRSQILLPIP